MCGEVRSYKPGRIYRYRIGSDIPHSVKESANTYYFFTGIGTPGVVGLVDSTGALKNRYRYGPWGALEDSIEAVPNVLKYAGQEFDAETNLYYDRARYYDPQLARFISEDPIGLLGGINQYAYADDDPINNADPTGLDPTWTCHLGDSDPGCLEYMNGVITWGSDQFPIGGGGSFADFSGPRRPQPADARRLMDGVPGPNDPAPDPSTPSRAVSCGAAVASLALDLAGDALFVTGVGVALDAGEGLAEAVGNEFIKSELHIQYTPPTDYNTMRSVAITIGTAAWKTGANFATDHSLEKLAEKRAPKWYETLGGFIPGVRTIFAGKAAYEACFKKS